MQSLFGYDATKSGLVLSPAGLFAIMMLFIVGTLMSRGVDARYFIAAGLIVLAIGNYWLSQQTLDIGPWRVVWARVVVISGLSMIFAPLNVAAFRHVPLQLRGAAVGLFALLRNEGGSVGTSVAKTILERREQFHTLRMNETLDPFNPAVAQFLQDGQNFLHQTTGDPVAALQITVQTLQSAREQQALALAYFDVFWCCAALAAVLVFMVLLMKRSVAEKGEHIAAD